MKAETSSTSWRLRDGRGFVVPRNAAGETGLTLGCFSIVLAEGGLCVGCICVAYKAQEKMDTVVFTMKCDSRARTWKAAGYWMACTHYEER